MNNDVKYTLSLRDFFTAAIRKARGETDGLDNSINKVRSDAQTLTNTLKTAFAAFATSQVARGIYEVGTGFENAQMGLRTLLKDNAAAAKEFNDILQDAATTPFDFKSLLMANRALLAAGDSADNARAVVKDLANAIAASGGGNDELQRMVVNLQQIKNTGKATAMDIKQFAFAGINIYGALAAATNEPIEKVREMDVTYETLAFALAKARQQGGMFENGLSNAMNTVSGKASNLGDQFDMLRFKIFNMGKAKLNTLMDTLSGIITKVGELINKYRFEIKNLAEVVKGAFEGMKPGLMMAAGLFELIFKTSSYIAIQWNKLGALGKAIGGSLLTFVGVMYTLKQAQAAYNAMLAITAALTGNWVGLAVAGAIAAAAGIYYLADSYVQAKKKQEELAKGMKGTKPGTAQTGATTGKPKGVTAPTGIKPPLSSETTKTTAPQYTQIHVNIGTMKAADEINMVSSKGEDWRKISDKIMEMMTGALNDSQRMAAH